MLVVDDNKDLLDLYTRIFTRHKYTNVFQAEDGDKAIKLFSELNEKPDFILMDYRMPIMNGIDAAKELFRIKDDNIIIMMSADTSIIDEALKVGIKGFIKKPIEIGELFSQINEILAK